MGADQDVDLALLVALEHVTGLGGGAQPRDHLDSERGVGEALAEGAEVLLGEDRGRHQHHHLGAVGGRLVRGAQRDLGLAVADVAADQPVHRPLGLHVGLGRLDRVDLVGGLRIGEGRLELELPLAVGREGVAAANLALGVEVEQLAGQGLGGRAGAGLEALPALAAERRELRLVAVGAEVAADLRELVGGREDLVLALVGELEVVAGDPGESLGLEAGEAGDAVVLVDDVVADPQLDRVREPRPRRRRRLRPAAVDEAAVGDDRELQLRRNEALAQQSLRERNRRLRRRDLAEEVGVAAAEVVAGALGLAAMLEGDHGPVSGARQLLELGLGLAEGAGGRGDALGAERELAVGRGRREPQLGAPLERPGDVDVEPPRVVVVHRRGHVLPVVAQRRGQLLLAGEHDQGVIGNEVERRAEAVDRQQLGDVGPLPLLDQRGELAVLECQLGRRGQLDPLGLVD